MISNFDKEQMINLCQKEQKLEAVKMCMTLTGFDLKSAKDYVDTLESELIEHTVKKFEIINNKWIRKLEFDRDSFKSQSSYIKIEKIAFFDHRELENLGKPKIIMLSCGSEELMRFEYKPNEAKQFEEDLLFFQKLLF